MANDKAGRGTLRRNENKYEDRGGKYAVIAGKEKYPDYKGKFDLVVGDTTLKVYASAWVRKSEEGEAFMSIQLEYPNNESRRLTIAGATGMVTNVDPDGINVAETDEDLPF